MPGIRKKSRAMVKSAGYRALDAYEGLHARATQRAWYTPGASAAEQWLSGLAVSHPTSASLAGQGIVSLTIHHGIELSGPAEPAQWNSTPGRVARMKRIAGAAALDLTGFTDAHFALLDNIVNRYVAEFCAYPYQALRTMNLCPGDVFLDIGAFRGYVSVKAAQRVGDHGRVYAIEPIDENFGFVEHHRNVNQLTNLTTLKAAVTADGGVEAIDFFRTENQGNAAVKDHLRGDAHTMQVANVGAEALLRQVVDEMPEARRIICSLTTNGTEIAVVEAMIDALEQIGGADYVEIAIPVIFTETEARAFASRVAPRGWRSDLRRPWMRLWHTKDAS